MIGAAIGLKTQRLHLEFGVEKPLMDKEDDQQLQNPPEDSLMKVQGVLEMKLGKLTIGYIGKYYMGGFADPDMIVENQLVYQIPKSRLVNGINFSLGADKAFSISGSYSVSEVETEERVPYVDQVDTATIITAKTVSVELSYVY